MSEAAKGGLLDLEKELTCSICTDVLYQPLTLLDCLHTFCGSCLKLWFAWQASSSSGPRSNPYTCPSCRASVRGTRPDAKITTLLDMYLQVNPDKAKSDDEKKESAEKYAPGDDVIPRARVRPEDIDDGDRRMVEEVRELSLRDGDRGGRRGYERGARHRPRSRDSGRNDSGSSRAIRELEHQSSLRSLISNSELDSNEMEEEILRQIAEEGLLDGIDLTNLDERQQDELTERIADAYRRRQRERTNTRDNRRSALENSRQREPPTSSPSQQPGGRRQHARSTSTTDTTPSSSHPPISRPHLLEAYPAGQGNRRRRTASEGRRQTSPIPGSTVTRQEEATRSATDLSERPRTTQSRDRRPSDLQNQTRRITEPRPRRMSESNRVSPAGTPTSSTFEGPRRRESPRQNSPMSPNAQQTMSPLAQSSFLVDDRLLQSRPTSSPRRTAATLAVSTSDRSRPSSSGPQARSPPPAPSVVYTEPSISCDSCGRKDLQYDLHANCEQCRDGKWNICHRCYRSGKGCLNYFGFGHAAWHQFERRSTPGQELPHALVGHQYKKPSQDSLVSGTSSESGIRTSDNPADRLLVGTFCYICKSHVNDCLWQCNVCNDGEWGYCSNCVRTGSICTHPLLPVAHVSAPYNTPSRSDPSSSRTEATFAPPNLPNSTLHFPPSSLRASTEFRPLLLTIKCSLCTYPIPPNQSRFHCFSCDDGDYDICNACYAKLCDSGRISRDNGTNGWRRCLRGHRMIVYFFEDSSQGQRRVVVRDVVGGTYLKDELDANGNITTPAPEEIGVGMYSWVGEDGERQSRKISGRLGPRTGGGTPTGWGTTSNRFPPDGGVGMRVRAMYTWLPADGVTDELSFPRNAEIREALEVSSEWFQGSYAGVKGLFPSNYGRVLEKITY